MEFNAPIPGQSLTAEPGNSPWENPPEMVDPEDVVLHYLSKLGTDEVKQALVDSLELGVEVKTLTEGLLRTGVAKGRHSIDVSLLVAPIVHEFIKGVAESADIEYEEGFPKEDREEIDNAISSKKIKEMLDSLPEEEPEELEEMPEDLPEEDPKLRGLMVPRGEV